MAEDRGGDDADKTNTAQEHHHDLYHYVFIIVGSIVTAGIEFALVWPENHHLALLLIQPQLADDPLRSYGPRRRRERPQVVRGPGARRRRSV